MPSSFARDLPDPGIDLSPSVLAGKFFITEPSGKHQNANTYRKKKRLLKLSQSLIFSVNAFFFFFSFIVISWGLITIL